MSASLRGMYWTAGRPVSLRVSARVVSAITRPLQRTRTRFGLGSIVIGLSFGSAMLVSFGWRVGQWAFAGIPLFRFPVVVRQPVPGRVQAEGQRRQERE